VIDKYEPYQATKWERRVDALFGLVSTRAALNRMVNREKMNWFRYLAAQPTSARRNAPFTTAGEWLKVQREKLQIMWNAIQMVDNSGLCTGILVKFPTYVCGTLGWQARTGDKKTNDQYEEYLKQKCNKPGNIDITRRYTLRQMCMLDIRSIALKGDVGTNVVRDGDEIYLQGIEADRIGDPYKWVTTQHYVRGLDLDDYGAITGVHVFHQDRLTGYYKFDDVYSTRTKQGLPNFLFFTNPIDYDNYRGVSLFKHAIDNSTYIDRMRQYELQALLWAASQSGVYYTKSGGLPEALPFNRIPMTDTQGNMIDTFETRPNTISALSSEGEKVEMFQHDRPSPNVIGMYENTVRDIAIGAGLTYGFCYNMTGLTGPAVRQCSAQDARAIQTWQEMLREQKLDQVVMLMLGDAIAKGDLPYHKNWLRWEWFFPAKPTIDVGRESQANIEELEAGINTGANIVAENGLGDIHEVITQRSKEIEMMIEAAQDVAERLNLPWEQVYAMMIPPPRQSGRGGGLAASAGAAGALVGRSMGRGAEEAGATSGGVALDGENGDREFSVKKKSNGYDSFSIETDENGDITVFYDPSEPRDRFGKWTEGGASGVLYHGTTSEGLTELKPNVNGVVFVTPDKHAAESHTVVGLQNGEFHKQGEIHQISHRIENPVVVGAVAFDGLTNDKKFIDKQRSQGHDAIVSDDGRAIALMQSVKPSKTTKSTGIHKYSQQNFYDPNEPRDERGRWTDEGGGAAVAEPELSGIDKALVDYKPGERSLTDPSKIERIDEHLSNARYVQYSKTPFFTSVSAMQGVLDPSSVSGADYKKMRDDLFNKQPVTEVPLDKLVVTQPDVNKDRLAELAKQPPDTGAALKPIHAVRYNGETYVLNGHHRAVDAVDRGKSTIKANVLNLSEDENKTYAAAARAKPQLDNLVNEVAAAHGAEPLTSPLKSLDRARAKVQGDYGGDWSRIKDVARARIITKDDQSSAEVVDDLSKRLGIKPKETSGEHAGFKDYKFNPAIEGHHVEISVLTEHVNGVANSNHHLYEKAQAIERNANNEKRALTESELTELHSLAQQMKDLYKNTNMSYGGA